MAATIINCGLVSVGDGSAGCHTLLYPSQDVEARYGFINDYSPGCPRGLRHFYDTQWIRAPAQNAFSWSFIACYELLQRFLPQK